MLRCDGTLMGKWAVVLLLFGAASAHLGKKWYVSHETGCDFRKCGCTSNQPCKTLRYTVSLAHNGDLIYLDGRGSKEHPYGCERPTAALPKRTGRFINKSLSVVGPHERAYLSCDHGLLFKSAIQDLNVSLNNLAFVRNGTSFTGNCSVSIFNCTFSECFYPLNMTGTILTLFLEMSVFENNTNCANIRSTQAGSVEVNISNAVFHKNHILPKSTYQQGMIDLENGMISVQVQDTLFQENYSKNPAYVLRVKTNKCCLRQLKVLSSHFHSSSKGVLVQGCAENMYFDKLNFINNTNTLVFILSWNNSSSNIILGNSVFLNNNGALYIAPTGEGTRVTVKITNCVFSGGNEIQVMHQIAIIQEYNWRGHRNSSYNMSLNNVTFANLQAAALYLFLYNTGNQFNLHIENCSFHGNRNYYNRQGCIVFVKLLFPEKKACNTSRIPGREVHFTNTPFEENRGDSGIVCTSNADLRFDNCSFVENSLLSATGNVIVHGNGYGNLDVRCGTFIQPRSPEATVSGRMNRYPGFILSQSDGHVTIKNTSFRGTKTCPTIPILSNIKANDVDLDPSTTIQCPNGTKMKFYNWTDPSSTILVNNELCHSQRMTSFTVFCLNCPLGTYSLEGSHSAGFRVSDPQCQPCPYGATCLDGIKAKQNFWGYEKRPSSLTFVSCPLEYCHPHNSSNVSDYNGCHGHRTGTLCGACADGYSEEFFSTRCREKSQCHDDWFWVFPAAYSITLALFLIFRKRLFSFIWRQTFWYKRPTKEAFQTQETHFDDAYLKITFYFYQVAELLLVKDHKDLLHKIPFLAAWFSLYDFELQYFSMSVGCPLPGLTVVTKQLFSSLRVLGSIACTVVIFLIHKGISEIWGSKKPSLTHYLAVVVETMLLGYERLADTTLSLLHCVPIGSESRLFLDGNVHCWQWWQIGLMVYIVVFVAPFIMVLYFGSLSLYRNKVSAKEFLGACALPLPFLLRWAVQYVRGLDTMQQQSSNGEEIQETLYEPFRTPTEQDSGAVYWESVLIGRRFVLLCLHSFIADPMFRLMSLDSVCVLILAHHIFKRPYRNTRANVCETVSLLALVAIATFNLAEAVFMSAGVEAAGPNEVGLRALEWVEVALLGILPASLCVLVTLGLLSQLCRLATVVISGSQNILGIRGRGVFSNAAEQQRPLLGTARYSRYSDDVLTFPFS